MDSPEHIAPKNVSSQLSQTRITSEEAQSSKNAGNTALPLNNIALKIDQVVLPNSTYVQQKILLAIAESIRKQGQVEAIIVRPLNDDNKYEVIKGERQFCALRDILHYDTVVVTISNSVADLVTSKLEHILNKLNQKEYSPLKLANELKEIKKVSGWKSKQLAKRLSLSEGWVSKKLGLLKAPPEIKVKIEKGELAETVYYNNKKALESAIKQKDEYQLNDSFLPTAMLKIPVTIGYILAEILKSICDQQGASRIELNQDISKSGLQTLLCHFSVQAKKNLKIKNL